MPSTVVVNQVPVELVDEDGNKVNVHQDGGAYFLNIKNDEQLSMLASIHTELKKMNFYLSQLVDIELGDDEVGE